MGDDFSTVEDMTWWAYVQRHSGKATHAKIAEAVGVTPPSVSRWGKLQVQSRDDFEDELARPVYPRVVGYAEVADMASVSRQRARQFADKDSFPKPVIVTAQGPLFDFHAIEQWLATRSSKRQPARA